ncbi:MAG: IS3 family transposase [Candidatus Dormibacteria bacterium]
MGRSRRPYPPEFRREAVQLVHTGVPIPKVAADLGVNDQTIRNWVNQADVDAGKREGLSTEERAELTRLRRENRVLKMEREILGKSKRFLREGDRAGAVAAFRFVEREKAFYPVAIICRVLGVSPSGFYAWQSRPPSKRALDDAELTEIIRNIHRESRGTYGVPRVFAELVDDYDIHCSKKRVARLMTLAGLVGCHRRRRIHTTQSDKAAKIEDDLVNRDFTATTPDRLYVADITYLPTWMGFLFLAVVIDVYTRRVVGWAFSANLRTELVLDALNMALHNRRPKVGAIHHSDHGSQFTSYTFGKRCREAGLLQSMGSIGDCYDNALCESFFATLECELIDRTRWETHAAAKLAVFDFIEVFYNRRRRHSGLGQLSPEKFERRWAEQQAA